MTTRTGVAAALFGAAAIVAATACGSDTPPEDTTTTPPPPTTSAPAAQGPPGPATATITISGFDYSRATVRPGGQVTVQNNDEDEHTVTSNTPGGFDVTVPGMSSRTFPAPAQPGSYPFGCDNHASMHGTLTVQ